MLLLVVYNGIIPTPSFMSNQLKFKVMVNKLVKKCSVKLNSRKQICLCFGNSTPFCIEGKAVDFTNFSSEERKKLSDLCLPTLTQYFHAKTYFDENIPPTLRHKWNLQLSKFVEDCNKALSKFPELQTKKAKDIALFVLGGCKSESLNAKITFADFLDIIINDQKGKEENPESANFQVYITLKNSLKNWEKFNYIISDLHQADYYELSNYLKNRIGKNGKKGANWERMMQCYRAVINAAISTRYNNITGCNVDNYITFDKKDEQLQFKQRSEKSIVELYNEKNNKDALTFEQVEAFKAIDPSTLIISIPTRHNGKSYTYTINNDIVCLCYDICTLMLATNGMRTKDVIRIKKELFDLENKRIIYLPHKLNRYSNDDRDIQNHSTPVRFNADIIRIFEKYKNSTNTDFLFPCKCNVCDGGKWNPSRYEDTKGCMNALLKEIGKMLNLNFKLTTYVLRKTAITCNADMIYKELKERAIEEAAKMAGTSKKYGQKNYYKCVNGIN